jgi:hypothetical protein
MGAVVTAICDEGEGLTLCERHSQGYDWTQCHVNFKLLLWVFLCNLIDMWHTHGTKIWAILCTMASSGVLLPIQNVHLDSWCRATASLAPFHSNMTSPENVGCAVQRCILWQSSLDMVLIVAMDKQKSSQLYVPDTAYLECIHAAGYRLTFTHVVWLRRPTVCF